MQYRKLQTPIDHITLNVTIQRPYKLQQTIKQTERQINGFNQLQILCANHQLNVTRIKNPCSWNHVEPHETLVKPRH